MGTIDQLNQTNIYSDISPSDLMIRYSASNGDTRKNSLAVFVQWLATQLTLTGDNKQTQYSNPLTGSTVIVNGAASAVQSNSVWLILTPVATIAALTIQLPAASACVDKQELLINSTQIITALTFTFSGGTVSGAPNTLVAGGSTRLRYDAATLTWYKV